MSRRATRRDRERVYMGTGTGLAPPVSGPTFYGLAGWAGTGFPSTGAGLGLVGILDTPLWRAGIIRIDSQAVASAPRFLAAYFTGAAGWRLTTAGTNSTLQFDVIDSTVNLRAAPTYTIAPGDVGKLIHWYGWWDGTTVNLAISGVATGAGTACASYAQPPGTSTTAFGARSTGQFHADGITILGLVGGNGAKTIADAVAHYNACKAAGGLVAAGSDHCWDVNTSKATAASLVLPDLVGSDNMNPTGSPAGITLQVIPNPQWVNITPPSATISIPPWIGDTATCSVSPPGAYTFVWKRDGVAIPGATSQSYTYAAADIGPAITCEATLGSTIVSPPVQLYFSGVAARTGVVADLALCWDMRDLAVGPVTTLVDRVAGVVLNGSATLDTSLNGKKTLVFNGTTSGFASAAPVNLGGGRGYTGLVSALNTYGASAGILWELGPNAAASSGFHLYTRSFVGNELYSALFGSANASGHTTDPAAATAGVYTAIGDFVLNSGESAQVWKNGQILTPQSNNGNANTPDDTFSAATLNVGFRAGPALRYAGKMAGALVFYKRPLTWNERQHAELINGYLSGVAVSVIAQANSGIVVGCGGQSNALGQDTDLSGLPSPWPPADTAAKLRRYLTATYAALVEPVNGVGGTFTIGFADTVIRDPAYSGAAQLVIASAPPISATKILQWMPGTANYNNLLATMYTPKVFGGYQARGLLWYQGEADTMDAGDAANWQARTLAMFAQLRLDLKEPTLPIVAVRLHPTNPGFPFWADIRTAASGLVGPNTIVVDSAGALMPDNTHLTTLAEKALGEAMAAAYLAVW